MKIDPQLKEELKKYIAQRSARIKNKVTVFSPYPVSEKEMGILKDNLPLLREAQIVNTVDPGLIAGVVVEFGTKRIDLSLKGELQNLKQLIYDIT